MSPGDRRFCSWACYLSTRPRIDRLPLPWRRDEVLAILRREPGRWWTYAALALVVYGYADRAERHALRSMFGRLRGQGVGFEFERNGHEPIRFRLAAESLEAAS